MSDNNPGDRKLTREERVQAALRANLRRRKAQARGREADQGENADSDSGSGVSRPRSGHESQE